MSLGDVLRELGDDLAGDVSGQRVAVKTGTVATVTAGAAADGNAAVTVTVDGMSLDSQYDAAYTPTVGHIVWVVLVSGSPIIAGRLIGQPVV